MLRKVFVDKLPASLLAARLSCSVSAVRKRLRLALGRLGQRPLPSNIPDVDLVLLADGLWFMFKRRPWVLYNMAVKPVSDDIAFLLEPLLLPGRETAPRWREALATIPPEVNGLIKALVSDGFPGSKAITRERQWIQQRCHFHILLQLYNRLGKRKPALPGRKARLAIYAAIRVALETNDEAKLAGALGRLRRLAHHPECPPRVSGIAREFLRDVGLYRAYLEYPALGLPSTVSSIESYHSLVREITNCVNNPKAVLQRVRGYIRLHPVLTCNHKNHQQN